MRRILEETPNLYIKQAEVTEILHDGSRVVGIELLDGRRVSASGVILTTGTFLNGLIHIGEKRFSAGRNGDRHRCPWPNAFAKWVLTGVA
jgi:tRNA uridine 5-carboxymethylaminomethyl modification enzyme